MTIMPDHCRYITSFVVCSGRSSPVGRRVARRPVSRVLSHPCGLGRPFLWDAPCSAPHATNPGDGARTPLRRLLSQVRRPPLFGLAPGGVYPAAPVTGGAVRSYRTVSPLLSGGSIKTGQRESGLFSVALSLGSPPPAVNRHRVPVEPGLSSTPLAGSSGRPAVWRAGDALAGAVGQATCLSNSRRGDALPDIDLAAIS